MPWSEADNLKVFGGVVSLVLEQVPGGVVSLVLEQVPGGVVPLVHLVLVHFLHIPTLCLAVLVTF